MNRRGEFLGGPVTFLRSFNLQGILDRNAAISANQLMYMGSHYLPLHPMETRRSFTPNERLQLEAFRTGHSITEAKQLLAQKPPRGRRKALLHVILSLGGSSIQRLRDRTTDPRAYRAAYRAGVRAARDAV